MIKVFYFSISELEKIREVEVDYESLLREIRNYELVEQVEWCYEDTDYETGEEERTIDLSLWIEGGTKAEKVNPEALTVDDNFSFSGVVTIADEENDYKKGLLLADGSWRGKTSFYEEDRPYDHYEYRKWFNYSLRKKR